MTGSDEQCAVEKASVRADSGDARRDNINWAWAVGVGHYDWMDHAPLFHHCE